MDLGLESHPCGVTANPRPRPSGQTVPGTRRVSARARLTIGPIRLSFVSQQTCQLGILHTASTLTTRSAFASTPVRRAEMPSGPVYVGCRCRSATREFAWRLPSRTVRVASPSSFRPKPMPNPGDSRRSIQRRAGPPERAGQPKRGDHRMCIPSNFPSPVSRSETRAIT